MKIIIRDYENIRISDEDIKENLLDLEFYISKNFIEKNFPVYFIIENKSFLLKRIKDNENYNIYKIFNLFDALITEGEKECFFNINNKDTKIIKIYFPLFKNESLTEFLKRRGK